MKFHWIKPELEKSNKAEKNITGKHSAIRQLFIPILSEVAQNIAPKPTPKIVERIEVHVASIRIIPNKSIDTICGKIPPKITPKKHPQIPPNGVFTG